MFGLPIKGCYIYDEDGARKPNQLKIKVMEEQIFKVVVIGLLMIVIQIGVAILQEDKELEKK
tara:strand:- start:780 stop:965 length:186 start_codon:yes stop_codon:yes gene_type:complete